MRRLVSREKRGQRERQLAGKDGITILNVMGTDTEEECVCVCVQRWVG